MLTRPDATRRDFAPTLARGLEVLRAFDGDRERMTLADVSKLVDLPRATVRRALLTLTALGYIETDGKLFRTTPKVLVLAQSYLANAALPRVVQPQLEKLSDRLGESCSVSILHNEDVIYVARSARKRLASLHRDVGTHLPAWCTSMGRVLLAALPDHELNVWLAHAKFERLTPHTIVDAQQLRARLIEVRRQGWCLIQQELEFDLISLAVPLANARGRVVAALNTNTQLSRRGLDVVITDFLPALLGVAQELRPLLV
jgi:IclR family transcriptional regulator, pca regulon regulatory protein